MMRRLAIIGMLPLVAVALVLWVAVLYNDLDAQLEWWEGDL